MNAEYLIHTENLALMNRQEGIYCTWNLGGIRRSVSVPHSIPVEALIKSLNEKDDFKKVADLPLPNFEYTDR